MMETTDNKSNKRAVNWTDAEVYSLVNVWKSHLDELRSNKRNLGVYCKMQCALEEGGIQRSVSDIKNKIKNLSKEYRKIKSNLGTGSAPPTWKFCSIVNEVVGGLPLNDDSIIYESFKINNQGENYDTENYLISSQTNKSVSPWEASSVTELQCYSPQNCNSSNYIDNEGQLSTETNIITITQSLSASTNTNTTSTSNEGKARKIKNNTEQEKVKIMKLMLKEQKRSNEKAEEIDKKILELLEKQLVLQNKFVHALNNISQTSKQ